MSVSFDSQLAFHILNGFFEDRSYVKKYVLSLLLRALVSVGPSLA